MSTKRQTNGFLSHPLQRIFWVSAVGVELGLPEGACFLMQPGKDYTLANDCLYGIHTGKFRHYSLFDRPAWMNSMRGKLRPRSLRSIAQAFAVGRDVLDAHEIDILEFDGSHINLIGEHLSASGVETGIGMVQMSALKLAQWAVGADYEAR